MNSDLKTQTTPLKMLAKTMAGLEEILAEELRELGAQDVQILKRAVSFEGDRKLLYKVNYESRLALRILIPLATFNVSDEKDLYVGVGKINWRQYVTMEGTIAVDSVNTNSVFNNSMFVSLKTKDAIVDQFRRFYGKRPSVDTRHPDLRVNVRISGSECIVSIDSSGESLHHRGYRNEVDKAPINEVLAAALVRFSGFKGQCHFVDPMCGSGTLIIEAAMLAMKMPAGYYRKEFGFEFWKDFDMALWEEVRDGADGEICEFNYEIIGGDQSRKAIGIAKENLRFARLHKDITLVHTPMEVLDVPKGPGIAVTNPPYGERLDEEDILDLYKSIGDTLKSRFHDYNVFVISSNIAALKNVGLKPSKRIPIFNGPLECRVFKFDIYEGSRNEE